MDDIIYAIIIRHMIRRLLHASCRRWHYFRAEQRQLPADIADRYAAAAIARRWLPPRHDGHYASYAIAADTPAASIQLSRQIGLQLAR
jgi:hypothetical protein